MVCYYHSKWKNQLQTSLVSLNKKEARLYDSRQIFAGKIEFDVKT